MSDKQARPDRGLRASPPSKPAPSSKAVGSKAAGAKRLVNQRLCDLLAKLQPFPAGD